MTPRTRHSVEAGEVEVHDCLNDDGTDLVIAVLRQWGVFKGDYVAIVVQPKPDQIGKPKIKYHGPDFYHIHVWRTVKAPQNLKPIPDYPPQQLQKGVLIRTEGERVSKCVLCRFRPYRRRVTSDLGVDALVCESCYPKTQPAPEEPKVQVKCDECMCGQITSKVTKKVISCSKCAGHGWTWEPAPTCTNKMCKDGEVYNPCPPYRNPCPTCRQKEYHAHKLTIYGTSIEVVKTPRYHTSWKGTCSCGFTCSTDESRERVENWLKNHNHLPADLK